MSNATLITFIVYLAVMLGIGVWAYFQTKNLSDYILGGRRLGGLVTALSASASDMSGWLLMGLPGAIYLSGLSEMWIIVGLAIGAYCNWKITAPRLRVYTEAVKNSITLPEYFTHRFEDNSSALRIISASVILVFFTVYVASGLTAGAKLFEASFNMSYHWALAIGALVIVSYTFIGGFLAVSWTDVVQGLLMVTALVIAPMVMVFEFNSMGDMQQVIANQNAILADPFKGTSALDYIFSLSFISLMAWGLGYFGQPHLLARFMAAQSVEKVHRARRIAMTWMVLGMLGAVFTGYFAIAFFSGHPLQGELANDSEKVFIFATQVLFNPWIAGALLAAILAAVMSTIDSQLLVSSSAVTEDFYKGLIKPNAEDKELVWVGRGSVLLVALIAIVIAVDKDSQVLSLVSNAWAGFGSAFGPVVLLSLTWKYMTRNGALAGMVTGALTVILWITFRESIPFGLGQVYEMIPGVMLSTLAIFLFSQSEQVSESMLKTFEQVKQSL